METTINQRVDLLIKALQLSANSFADAIGVSQPTVSKIIKGHNDPNYSTILSMIQTFGISPDWLITGRGQMWVPARNNAMEPPYAYAGQSGEYDQASSTGLTSDELNWDLVRKEVQKNHSVRIFRVLGNSMNPTLWERDLVFCYSEDGQDQDLKDTYIYVIDSKPHGGFLVKRIIDRKDGNITIYSDNRNVEKSSILNLRKEVNGIWRVRTKMTWQLGAPPTEARFFAELEKRLNDIEKSIKK